MLVKGKLQQLDVRNKESLGAAVSNSLMMVRRNWEQHDEATRLDILKFCNGLLLDAHERQDAGERATLKGLVAMLALHSALTLEYELRFEVPA